jgi:branched-chain amino acid transport system permease protein
MLIFTLFVNSLITGLYYALMAVGLTMIFGILKIVNFAHGEFYMIGAYSYALITMGLGWSPWLALPSAAVAGALIGWLTERFLIRPMYTGYTSWALLKDEYAVVVTFGLSLLLINLADVVVGPFAHSGAPLWHKDRIDLAGAFVTGQQVLIVGISVVLLALLALLMRYSLWGREIRAISQNRFGASIAGINTVRSSMVVFVVSGILAGLAGALLAPIIPATPDVGSFPAIKAYIIVVIGGMGSIPGSIIAAVLLGFVENYGAVYISYPFRDAYGLILLIVVLVLGPQGRCGERSRQV